MCFGDVFLHSPREEDLQRIIAINYERRFPGCIRSWNCLHWVWKKCPVAWIGLLKGKDKKPTVAVEAIVADKWLKWGVHSGKPAIMNDVNTLDCSSVVKSIPLGSMPPDFAHEVDNRRYNTSYYPVDGIYPRWRCSKILCKRFIGQRKARFSTSLEGLRMDLGRVVGVLISQWRLLSQPSIKYSKDVLVKTLKVAIIQQNMVV